MSTENVEPAFWSASLLEPDCDKAPSASKRPPLVDQLRKQKAKYERRIAALTAALDLLQADPANETVYAVIQAALRSGY